MGGCVALYTSTKNAYNSVMLLESEIAEEKTVTGMKVETPDGWKDIKKVYKTIPLDVWCVVTYSKTLKCSGHHLLKTPGGCVEVCELSAGDIVETIDGFEVILCVYDTGEREELYDITVDSEDGLFYSDGFISHNSTTFCTRQLLLTHLIPAYKSLYVVPHHKQLETYGARFGQIEMAFRIKSTVQNVYNKTYRNRSTVNMIHCGETSQAARGKSADECVSVTDRVTVLRDGKDTTIPLKDIKPGMMVKSFYQDEEGWGNFRYNKVEAYKDKGVQECFEIKTSDGIVTCTANHKLCAVVDNASTPYKTDWMYAKDLEASGVTQLVGYRGVTDILGITPVGEKHVADIQVARDRNFIAEGVVMHNCVIDECQSLDPEHVEDILYTLTDSQMPTKVFAGTALSIDTLLEAKWQESSMGMWHVRAMDGKNWLNMYDKDVLYKVCSNPQGPTCPYTGKLLKVTDGCFVHAYEDRYRDGRIGLHIPQCIIPDLAYNPIKWGAIYDKVKNTDFKKVLQECFGIAIAEGSREITSQDLQRMCVLPDTPEQLKQKCKDGFYRVVISGCDWGGSDYNPSTKTKTSYTVHCIIGLAPDNHIDILHYKRYSGMMYNEIAAHIIEDHNAYNGTALASDFGVGLAYNMELRKYIPVDRHFIIGYVGPKAAAVSVPKDAHLDNQLSVNRTEALTNVFRDAKCIAPQKICCRNWTEMKPFLEDWLNMFRVPTEDNTGRSTFKYIRAATKADDALHAFTFAYVLMKIFMGESLIHDPQLEQKIQAIMTAPNARIAETNFQREMFGDPVWCISG